MSVGFKERLVYSALHIGITRGILFKKKKMPQHNPRLIISGFLRGWDNRCTRGRIRIESYKGWNLKVTMAESLVCSSTSPEHWPSLFKS